MAANNFLACDAFTAREEGGFTADPDDDGNWTGGAVGVGKLVGTKYGISAKAYPALDIPNLTPEVAANLRKPGYWTPNQCDALPAGVDLMVYDEDVNTGDGRSARLLQAVLGVFQDGAVGPHTLDAVIVSDPVPIINRLAAVQIAFYRSLPTFSKFGAGWIARVTRRQTTALAMTASQAPEGN